MNPQFLFLVREDNDVHKSCFDCRFILRENGCKKLKVPSFLLIINDPDKTIYKPRIRREENH